MKYLLAGKEVIYQVTNKYILNLQWFNEFTPNESINAWNIYIA